MRYEKRFTIGKIPYDFLIQFNAETWKIRYFLFRIKSIHWIRINIIFLGLQIRFNTSFDYYRQNKKSLV